MAHVQASRFFRFLGPTEDLHDPLWNVRLCPVVCALFFLLAETVVSHGKMHPVILSMGWIQLPVLSLAMFRAKDIVVNGGIRGNGGYLRAVWVLRILPLVCATAILGSEFFRTDAMHGALLGFAAGLLCTILVVGFSATAVIPAAAQQRDDLQQLHLTR